MKIFIIGNGKSRLQFDVNSLKDYGKIIACNLAYNDINCDALSVNYKYLQKVKDERPNLDLITIDDPEGRRFIQWNGVDIGILPNHLIDTLDPHISRNWDSGRVALIAGILKYEPTEVYLLGFDFMDIPNPKKHWQKQDSNNVYHSNHIERAPQTELIFNWCVAKYTNTKFYRVGPLGDPILDKLLMDKITYDKFKNSICLWQW